MQAHLPAKDLSIRVADPRRLVGTRTVLVEAREDNPVPHAPIRRIGEMGDTPEKSRSAMRQSKVRKPIRNVLRRNANLGSVKGRGAVEDLRERIFDLGRLECGVGSAGVASDSLPHTGMVSPASGTPFGLLGLAPLPERFPPLKLGTSLLDAEVIEVRVERRIFFVTVVRRIFDIGGRVSGGRVLRHIAATATTTTLALKPLSNHTPAPEDGTHDAPSLRGGEGFTSGLSHESGENLLRFRGATVLVTQLDSRIVTKVPVVGVDVEDDTPVRTELANFQNGDGGMSDWA